MKRAASLWIFTVLLGLVGCGKKQAAIKPSPLLNAYDSEPDWNDPQKLIPLDFQQAQGKRVFYQQCVWCHADLTPSGPSNRYNVTPTPPLMNDGNVLNGESDDYLQNIITLGGSAMGKSAMMPPYSKMLTQDEIRAVIAFARAIAVPPYKAPARPGPKYSEK
jgi:mono/diheme cytochrome c family protein